MIRHAGVVLFELVIACLIVAIFAACMMRMVTWYDANLVRLEMDTLYCSLLTQAYRAVADEKIYDVQCLDSGWAVHDQVHEFSDGVAYGVIPGAYGPPAAPKKMISDPITFRNHAIIIYPDGKIQPGTVYFVDTLLTTAYALSCPVGKISYIRRYRYEGKEWLQV